MKSRELIRRIQEADPSGECECCVNNEDIHFVELLEAYYDGCLQVLVRDPAKEPYYSIVGAKVLSDGHKVKLHLLSIEDAIFNNEDMPVDLSSLSEGRQKDWNERIAKWRKETKDIGNEVERGFFIEYLIKRFGSEASDEIKIVGTEFYDACMSYKDPMPDDINLQKKIQTIGGQEYETIPSWHDRRAQQWDREISLVSAKPFVIQKETK
jgi:hypothetical protein